MAGSRTLKLSILADVDNLRKNLSAGSQEVASFGDKVTDFGKKAGLAFAAATAAATTTALNTPPKLKPIIYPMQYLFLAGLQPSPMNYHLEI